jgi:TfoX/Sxy family transcriptional regulator of competence genes
MASKQSTVDYLCEQITQAGSIRYRKMFGEYAIYCDEKVVALVCDDQLFLKPTQAGKELIEDLEEAPPYPGAKMYYLISPDLWEDRDYLSKLISTTASELPLPKAKKKKASS